MSLSTKSISQSFVYFQKLSKPPRNTLLIGPQPEQSSEELQSFLTEEEKDSIKFRIRELANEHKDLDTFSGYTVKQRETKSKIDAYCRYIVAPQINPFRVISAQIFSILSPLEKDPQYSELVVLGGSQSDLRATAVEVAKMGKSIFSTLSANLLNCGVHLNYYLREKLPKKFEDAQHYAESSLQICSELEGYRSKYAKIDQVYEELHGRLSLLNQCFQERKELFPLLLRPLDQSESELTISHFLSMNDVEKGDIAGQFFSQLVFGCRYFQDTIGHELEGAKQKLLEAGGKYNHARWHEKLDTFKKQLDQFVKLVSGFNSINDEISKLVKLRRHIATAPNDLQVVEEMVALRNKIERSIKTDFEDLFEQLRCQFEAFVAELISSEKGLLKGIKNQKNQKGIHEVVWLLATFATEYFGTFVRDPFHYTLQVVKSLITAEKQFGEKTLSIPKQILSNLPPDRRKIGSRFFRNADLFLVQILRRLEPLITTSKDPHPLFLVDTALSGVYNVFTVLEDVKHYFSKGNSEHWLAFLAYQFAMSSDHVWDLFGTLGNLQEGNFDNYMRHAFELFKTFPIRKDLERNKELLGYLSSDSSPYYFLSLFYPTGENIEIVDPNIIDALNDIRKIAIPLLTRLEFHFANGMKTALGKQFDSLNSEYQDLRKGLASLLEKPLNTAADVSQLARDLYQIWHPRMVELGDVTVDCISLFQEKQPELETRVAQIKLATEPANFDALREKTNVPIEYLGMELFLRMFYLEAMIPLLLQPFYEIAKIQQLCTPRAPSFKKISRATQKFTKPKATAETSIVVPEKKKVVEEQVVTSFAHAKAILAQALLQLKKNKLAAVPGKEAEIIQRKFIMHEMTRNMERSLNVLNELSQDSLLLICPYTHAESLLMAYALLVESALKYAIALNEIPDDSGRTHFFYSKGKSHSHRLSDMVRLLEKHHFISAEQQELIQQLEPVISNLSRFLNSNLSETAKDLDFFECYSMICTKKRLGASLDEEEELLLERHGSDVKRVLFQLHQRFFPVLAIVQQLTSSNSSMHFDLNLDSFGGVESWSIPATPWIDQLKGIKKLEELLLQRHTDLGRNDSTKPTPADNLNQRKQRSRQLHRDITGMSATVTALFELLQQVSNPECGYAKVNTLILKTSLLVHQSISSIINYLDICTKNGQHVCFSLIEGKYLTRLRLHDHAIGRNLDTLEASMMPVLKEEQRAALLELGNGLSTFTRYLSGNEPMAEKLRKCSFLSFCQESGGFYRLEDEELIQGYWGNVPLSERKEFFKAEMKRMKEVDFLPVVSNALEAVQALLAYAVQIRN